MFSLIDKKFLLEKSNTLNTWLSPASPMIPSSHSQFPLFSQSQHSEIYNFSRRPCNQRIMSRLSSASISSLLVPVYFEECHHWIASIKILISLQWSTSHHSSNRNTSLTLVDLLYFIILILKEFQLIQYSLLHLSILFMNISQRCDGRWTWFSMRTDLQ